MKYQETAAYQSQSLNRTLVHNRASNDNNTELSPIRGASIGDSVNFRTKSSKQQISELTMLQN